MSELMTTTNKSRAQAETQLDWNLNVTDTVYVMEHGEKKALNDN